MCPAESRGHVKSTGPRSMTPPRSPSMFNFIDSNLIDDLLNRRSASSDRCMSGAGILLGAAGGTYVSRTFSSELGLTSGQTSGGIASESQDKKRSGSLISTVSIRTDGEADFSMEVSPEYRPCTVETAPKGVIGAFSSAPLKGSVICTPAASGGMSVSRRGSDCSGIEGTPSATSGSLVRYGILSSVLLCTALLPFVGYVYHIKHQAFRPAPF
jgi:hypothetical protein